VLDDGEEIPSRTLIWAAGVQANPLAGELGLEQGKGGRIVVNPDLTVPGDPRVLVVGDLAAIPAGGGVLPQLAPVAMQSGRHAGRQIRRLLAGQGTTRFRYRNRGTMATIGRRAAVAELPLGIRLRGTVAWVAWLVLHLAMLIGPRNKLSVLVNWSWNYLTYDRNQRLIIESPADPVPPGEHGPEPSAPDRGESTASDAGEAPGAGERRPTVLGDDLIAD
jgi:NADH:ubiquinone reductase (H+-translocating)